MMTIVLSSVPYGLATTFCKSQYNCFARSPLQTTGLTPYVAPPMHWASLASIVHVIRHARSNFTPVLPSGRFSLSGSPADVQSTLCTTAEPSLPSGTGLS
jgi:hypothetical protein